LKCFVPLICIFVELWWAHGHWRSNMCQPGSKREGHFDIEAHHNFSNTWSLFGFLVAGMVDVASGFVELPSGMQHFMTSAAFGLQAFLLHEAGYPNILGIMSLYLLFMVVAGTAVAMWIEMALPDSFWPGALKVYCMWMQAIWYFGCARVMYEHRTAWDELMPVRDMAPGMFVPVVFVMWMNVVSLLLLIVFLFMRWWCSAHLNEHLKASCSVERTLMVDNSRNKDVRAAAGQHELVPLVARYLP